MKKWIRKRILRTVLTKDECTAVKTLSEIYMKSMEKCEDNTDTMKNVKRVLLTVNQKFQ